MDKQVGCKVCGTEEGESSHDIFVFLALLVVVGSIVLAVHWPALSARALSFDDGQYLIKNQLVQNPSWHSARRFLTEVLEPSTVGGYYQPLSMISLMLDVAFGGSAENLKPFHLTSLCLHVINTLLVIVLLYVLFGNVWPAVMVGLLFGVHPLTVEPIPWVGERKTLLASFFGLWCIIVYVLYARKLNWKLLVVCALLYLLALLAKPTTTPLPVLLLLLDFWPLKRLGRRSLQEKLPLFVIMMVFAFITFISQQRTAVVAVPGENSLGRITLILCHNIIFYLYKIVWPVKLSSHYPLPSSLAISEPMVLFGVVGTCILLPILLVSLRWTRAALTGWFFFFVAIFPTMGVIGFTSVIASDKFAYLPSVGLLIVLGWLLGLLWGPACGSFVRRVIIISFIVTAVVSESLATRAYLGKWQDTETLYRYMLSLTPEAACAHGGLASTLEEQGKVEEAIEHFRAAVRLKPNHYGYHTNLGLILFRQGQADEAVAHFYNSIRLKPNYAPGYKNLGLALALQNKVDEAIPHFRKAVQLKPADADLRHNLAVMLARKGLFDEAISEFREALRINPKHKEALKGLKTALRQREILKMQ